MNTALVIMSRLPLAGYTKTRLMEALNGDQCAAFHQACLQDICQAALDSQLTTYLYYHSPPEYAGSKLDAKGSIWGLETPVLDKLKFRQQKGADLGERLWRAGQEVLQDHSGVIFIGSDMPEITAKLLAEAERLLHKGDVVVGPASDGGYYLLGSQYLWQGLFTAIPWGSDRVLVATLEKIRAMGMSYRHLEAKADIDTIEDLADFVGSGGSEAGIKGNLQSYKAALQLWQGLK